eukprot:m.257421 g.257421  ORF g.257421 m.257421 type:complete len:1075 (-) comp20821_c0_seq1:36-3260(-)
MRKAKFLGRDQWLEALQRRLEQEQSFLQIPVSITEKRKQRRLHAVDEFLLQFAVDSGQKDTDLASADDVWRELLQTELLTRNEPLPLLQPYSECIEDTADIDDDMIYCLPHADSSFLLMEEVIDVEPSTCPPSYDQLAAKLQLKSLEDPFCDQATGKPYSEELLLARSIESQFMLNDALLPAETDSTNELNVWASERLASDAVAEAEVPLLELPEVLDSEPGKGDRGEDPINFFEDETIIKELAAVTAIGDAVVEESKFSFHFPDPNLLVVLPAAVSTLQPEPISMQLEREIDPPSAPASMFLEPPQSPATSRSTLGREIEAFTRRLEPVALGNDSEEERALVMAIFAVGESICQKSIQQQVLMQEFTTMVLTPPELPDSRAAMQDFFDVASLIRCIGAHPEEFASAEELSLAWDPLKPFTRIRMRFSAPISLLQPVGQALVGLGDLLDVAEARETVTSTASYYKDDPSPIASVYPAQPPALQAKPAIAASKPPVNIAKISALDSSLDDFLQLRGKGTGRPAAPHPTPSAAPLNPAPSAPTVETAPSGIAPPPSGGSGVQAARRGGDGLKAPGPPAPPSLPVESPLSVMAAESIMQDGALLRGLEARHNLTLVFGDSERMKGTDAIVSPGTAVLLAPLAELAQPEGFKPQFDRVLNTLLSFRTCALIISLAHEGSGGFANVGRLQALLSPFTDPAHPDGLSVKVLFASSPADTADLINLIAREAGGSQDRPWLREQASRHERFLLRLPCINTFAAQQLLHTHTLREILAGLDHSVLEQILPRHCTEAFFRIVDSGLALFARENLTAAAAMQPAAPPPAVDSMTPQPTPVKRRGPPIDMGDQPSDKRERVQQNSFHLASQPASRFARQASVSSPPPPPAQPSSPPAAGRLSRKRSFASLDAMPVPAPAQALSPAAVPVFYPQQTTAAFNRFPDSTLSRPRYDFSPESHVVPSPSRFFEADDTAPPTSLWGPPYNPSAKLAAMQMTPVFHKRGDYGQRDPTPSYSTPSDATPSEARRKMLLDHMDPQTPSDREEPAPADRRPRGPLSYVLPANSNKGQTKLRFKGKVPPTPTCTWK